MSGLTGEYADGDPRNKCEDDDGGRGPIIILVRPQMGENIGASARVMANFGLRELRIVNPRDGWPNARADALAGHALPVVEQAKLFATTEEAVADLQVLFATSARDRDMMKPVMEPQEAAAKLAVDGARGLKTGILFGPERTGLENEELALADAMLTMETDAACPSINLSHAVGVVAYCWSRARVKAGDPGVALRANRDDSKGLTGSEEGREILGSGPRMTALGERMTESSGKVTGMKRMTVKQDEVKKEHIPATKEQMEGLFGHLEEALTRGGFWKEPTKKPYMWKNIRATLMRAEMSAGEVQTWRGIVRALMGADKG